LLPDADDVAGRIAKACDPQVTFGVSGLHDSSAVSGNLVEDLVQIRDVDVRSDASVSRYLKISAPMTDDMARAVGEASLLPITTYNPAEDLAIELRGLDAVSRRDFEIRHRSIPEGRRRQLLLIGHNLTIPHHIAIGYGMSISILRRQPVGHNPALPETRTTELPTKPDQGLPFAADR
jgi:hypothetical protein